MPKNVTGRAVRVLQRLQKDSRGWNNILAAEKFLQRLQKNSRG
jgi:hypothetical protein